MRIFFFENFFEFVHSLRKQENAFFKELCKLTGILYDSIIQKNALVRSVLRPSIKNYLNGFKTEASFLPMVLSTDFRHVQKMPQTVYVSLTYIYKASLYQNTRREVIVTRDRPLRNDPALPNEREDISTLYYYQLES